MGAGRLASALMVRRAVLVGVLLLNLVPLPLTGGEFSAVPAGGAAVVLRQDHGQWGVGRNALGRPLRLTAPAEGAAADADDDTDTTPAAPIERGWGTSAPSWLRVRLPGPGDRFTALVGLDADPEAHPGAAVFSVHAGGRLLWRSRTVATIGPALTVDVPLAGAWEFDLRVDQAGGSEGGLADWGEPVAMLTDGRELRLAESAPVDSGRMLREEPPAAKPTFGVTARRWDLASADTRFGVAVDSDHRLAIVALGPVAGPDQIRSPSVLPLPSACGDDPLAPARELPWILREVEDQGPRLLRLRFACERPRLGLELAWQAWPGRGPIRQTLALRNRGDATVRLRHAWAIDLDLAGPEGPCTAWSFHSDGGTPDRQGVYQDPLGETAFSQRIVTDPGGAMIPLVVIDRGGRHGVYLGVEWAAGLIRLSGQAAGIRLEAGNGARPGTPLDLAAGTAYNAPPCFVGAYRGDLDDAGNNLRHWWWDQGVPQVMRGDPGYPKVQWNAFGSTGTAPRSWTCVEHKFRRLVDDIAPLGFEEAMIDVGWWGDATPDGHRQNWPEGMRASRDHAHAKGLRFGLYWTDAEDMANPAGRKRRGDRIRHLFARHGVDLWRSDTTRGALTGAAYAQVAGFFALLDELAAEIPGYQWENCACGGQLKDYGTMRRCVKVFITDTYPTLHVRQTFFDSSHALHPAQLEGCVGSTDNSFRPRGEAGMRFAWRSTSMGAPEWFIDAPSGLNGAAPWTDAERAAVKAEVALWKERIRPLVRAADLYHVLPRPDGRRWDGIQYWDPRQGRGLLCLFKPAAQPDRQRIALRGLEPDRRYRISFQDGSNPAMEADGAVLAAGFEVGLAGGEVSELVWIEALP